MEAVYRFRIRRMEEKLQSLYRNWKKIITIYNDRRH